MPISDNENKMPCKCSYQLAVKIHNHLHLYMHNIAELTALIMIRNTTKPSVSPNDNKRCGCMDRNLLHFKYSTQKDCQETCFKKLWLSAWNEIIIRPQLNIHATMQHKTLQINNYRGRVTIIYFQTQIFKRNYAALL